MAKVCVIGAAGGIGQPLSLLLMKNENIKQLALYDIVNVTGIVEDLKGCNYSTNVTAYERESQLPKALSRAHIVVIVAGVTIKPHQTRDDVFPTNAKMIVDLCKIIQLHAPDSLVAIVTNPVNALVPLAVETLNQVTVSCDAAKRVFGVTTLDVTRAAAMATRYIDSPAEKIVVPVVGGHDEETIIPLLSKAKPTPKVGSINDQVTTEFTRELRAAGHKVLLEKKQGTATLSTANATEQLVNLLVMAKVQNKKVSTYAYVKTNVVPGCDYFATLVDIWTLGITKVHPLGELSKLEQGMVDTAVPFIKRSVRKGETYALQKNKSPPSTTDTTAPSTTVKRSTTTVRSPIPPAIPPKPTLASSPTPSASSSSESPTSRPPTNSRPSTRL